MDMQVSLGRDLGSTSYHNLWSTARSFGIITGGIMEKMDGIGSTIKHWTFRDVKSEKVIIKTLGILLSTHIRFWTG